jgi:condensin complex subunit 3
MCDQFAVTNNYRDIRKEVIKNIGIGKLTLPAIIDRTRDVKDDVRKVAFERLLRLPIKKIAIAQRTTILKNGLRERSVPVRATCVDMLIEQWLKQLDNDILQLLECLDVESSPDTSELVLETLFKEAEEHARDYKLNFKIDFENLTPESVLYWRCRCAYLYQNEKDDALEEILPNTTGFCGLIMKYAKNEFITRELLYIAKFLDYADEVGRKNMNLLLAEMLVVFKQPEAFVPEIIHALAVVSPSREEFLSTVFGKVDKLRLAANSIANSDDSDIVANTKKLQNRLKQLRTKKSALEKEQKELAEAEEYDEAAKTKNMIKQTVNDINDVQTELDQLLKYQSKNKGVMTEEIALLIRAMTISHEFLRLNSDPNNQSRFQIRDDDIDHIQYVLNDLILAKMDNENKFVRELAYRVLGQFCTLKQEIGRLNYGRIITCLNNEDEDALVQTAALKGLMDMLLVHKTDQLFGQPAQEGEESEDAHQQHVAIRMNEIMTAIENVLLRPSSSGASEQELRTVCVEGIAKLMLCKKIAEDYLPDFISTLILFLFDPSTEEDTRLRQCLTVFIPAYAFSFAENMKQISGVVMSTLRRVAHCPAKASTIGDINLLQLAQYLVHLTNVANLQESQQSKYKLSEISLHERIAIDLCYEILAAPKAKESAIYGKILDCLVLIGQDARQIHKIKSLLGEVSACTTNKTAGKAVDKFAASIKMPEDAEVDEEQVAQEIESEKQQHEDEYTEFVDGIKQAASALKDTTVNETVDATINGSTFVGKRKVLSSRSAAVTAEKKKAAEKKKTKAAPKKRTRSKRKQEEEEEDEEAEDSEEEEPVETIESDEDTRSPPQKYKRAPTGSARPKRTASKKKAAHVDSDEDVLGDEDFEEVLMGPPKRASTRSSRASTQRKLDDEFDIELDENDSEDEEAPQHATVLDDEVDALANEIQFSDSDDE